MLLLQLQLFPISAKTVFKNVIDRCQELFVYFITLERKWPQNTSERAGAGMGSHTTSAQKSPLRDLPSVSPRSTWKASNA